MKHTISCVMIKEVKIIHSLFQSFSYISSQNVLHSLLIIFPLQTIKISFLYTYSLPSKGNEKLVYQSCCNTRFFIHDILSLNSKILIITEGLKMNKFIEDLSIFYI